MKKLFISQPMKGLTKEEILEARKDIYIRAEKIIGEPVELIDSYFEDDLQVTPKSIPAYYLGKSIELLSQADVVYFGGDWRNARGCKIEHEVAVQYGFDRIEE